MASQFKIKVFNGTDPQAQYDALTKKDSMTFYLLSTGVGYLGSTPLFGGGANNTIFLMSEGLTNPEEGKLYVLSNVTYKTDKLTGLYFYNGTSMNSYSDELITNYLNTILIKDMSADDYTGDDKTIATTKAIMDMIGKRLSDSTIVNAKFFRNVKSHTITTDDLKNSSISLPADTQEGDVGLLFTADIDDKIGNEQYFFVSLKEYLTSAYTFESSNSIELEISEDNKVKANLKVNKNEKSLTIDKDGVHIEKTTIINDGTGTQSPSTTKLVTEEALVQYIKNTLLPNIHDLIKEATEDIVTVDIDSLNRDVKLNGTSYANLTEAINDINIGGTITLNTDTASDGIQAQSGSNFTIDLAGNTLVLSGQMAGSTGTQTNGFQFLKDSNIVIKNGTIVSENAKMVIQNYSNLTLDNVTIEGKGENKYLLSNNYGNVILKNNTKILAKLGMVAFDLYYGMASVYDDGVTVTIADNTVVIQGIVEYGKAARANEVDFETKCKLITPTGYSLNIPEGYEWKDNGNGTQILIKK